MKDNTNSKIQNKNNYKIFDNLQEDVIIYNVMRDMLDGVADLRVKYVNNTSIINEIMPEEIVGKTVTELYDEDVAALQLEIAGEVLKSEDSKKYEAYFKELDKYYSVSAYLLDDDTYITISTDITELKKAGEAAFEANKELEQTFNAVPDLITLLDNEHKVIRANNAMADKLGVKPEECVGLPCYSVVHGTNDPPSFCPHSQLLKDGFEHATEVYENSLGGNFLVSVSPIYDDAGELIGSVHVARDINDLKKVEEKIQRLADVVESSDDAIITKSLEGNILSWNKGAEQIYGYSSNEVLGKHISILEPPQLIKETEELTEKIKNREKVHHYETLRLKKDGTLLNVSVTLSPVFDASGKLVAISTIARDITLRKLVEKQKQELLENVQQFAEELEVSNEELQDTTEELQVANKELQQQGTDLIRLNRTLHALRDSSHVMMHAKDETGYLNEVCRIIIEDCGHTMAWIGFAEDDEHKTVRPVTHSGFDKGYIENLKVTWADNKQGWGPTGTAIRTGEPCGCSDMLTDPNFQPWREEAMKRGYASSLVLPLISNGKTLGALTIYSKETDSFSNDEIESLAELADDVAFGITSLRLRAEREKFEEALRKSEEKFSKAFNNNPAAMTLSDAEGRYIDVNESYSKLTGYNKEELIGHTSAELNIIDLEKRKQYVAELQEKGLSQDIEFEMQTKFGEKRIIISSSESVEFDSGIRNISFIYDITERKRAEQERETTVEFLNLVNNSKGTNDLIHSTTTFFQQKSGCEAVGIRLKEGKDYPYYEARGFPEEFILLENDLCQHDEDDEIIRNNDNNPFIECMCRNVICGRYNPSKSFFTADGSFWTNCTTELLASTSEKDRLARTRNKCNGEGYESVALIPLHVGKQRLGLLQLNDQKKGMFSPEMISLWERMAGYLAVALAKCEVEETLKKVNDNLEELVENRTAELEEAYKDLKTDEEELTKQTELLNLTHEAIIVRDMEGKILFWNDGAEKMYGWSTEEAKDKITHLLLRTKFPTSPQEVDKKLVSNDKWEGELVHTKRDSTQITVISRQVLKKDENGNPNSILEINSDITERKKAEKEKQESLEQIQQFAEELEIINEELRATTEELQSTNKDLEHASNYNRSLIEASLDPLVTIGPDGKITDVNCATESVTGHSRDELISTDFSDYFTQPEKARVGYQQVFRDAMVLDYPLEIKHKSGHITPVLYNASVYHDESGEIIGVFAAARDITERKKAEEQLNETIEELKRSNDELQQFAYITSHDLQEPLRNIASFAQLLDRRYKGKLDSDADEFLDYMVDGASRMKAMILGLLDYSRVGTHGEELKPVNIENAVDQSLSNLKTAIDESNAVIEIDPLPTLVADNGQIIRLFQNLIGNAIKFKKEDEYPKIHISALKDKKNDEYIFSVSDNGIGMESQYTDQIFKVFKRLHSIGKYPGAGIGLSITKRIIERHNGRIWVESEFGTGSTFYFTIPINLTKS